ncbi:MAG: amidohydrolase [Acidobacteriota bacterium]
MGTRLATLIVVVILAITVAVGLSVGKGRDDAIGPVDLIVFNGKVFTGAGQTPAEAVAIRGNQIVEVGTNADIRRTAKADTKVIDAHGGSVLPGFTDSHIHFMSGGLNLERVNLLDDETLDAIQRRIREFAAAHPDYAWIRGRGWYYSPFPGGLPTRQMLDELVPDRPAYIGCYDGHTAWANTIALKLAGITRNTPDPKDGVIVRDPKTGEPTGVLKEAAKGLMSKVLPEVTREDELRAVRKAVVEANRVGITSIHEAGTSGPELDVFEKVRAERKLNVRIYAALSVDAPPTDAKADEFDALRQRFIGNPLITVGAIKVMLDGVIEAHTAAMLAPYANKATSGHANYTPEQLQRLVDTVDRRGWQIWTHAIGDGAVRMTLDAYEHAAQVNPAVARGRRNRVEHAETIDPADIPRFAKLNAIASYMPFHANPSPAMTTVWSANLGPDRASRGWISKTLQSTGARLAFGSDWPVVTPDPRMGLQVAVNRKTADGKPEGGWLPEQTISLESAIEAYTSGAAYASFEETSKGRIAAGMLADLVILSKDIFSRPRERLLEGMVTTTIFDGRVVYLK